MLEKLSNRDRKTLAAGAVISALILLWAFVIDPLWRSYKTTASQLSAEKTRIDQLVKASGKQGQAVRELIPAFEMPQKDALQTPMFRDRVTEQLQKAGMQIRSLDLSAPESVRGITSCKSRTLNIRAAAQFGRIMDLLADLAENPYLFEIKSFKIKKNAQNSDQFELYISLSTLIKVN